MALFQYSESFLLDIICSTWSHLLHVQRNFTLSYNTSIIDGYPGFLGLTMIPAGFGLSERRETEARRYSATMSKSSVLQEPKHELAAMDDDLIVTSMRASYCVLLTLRSVAALQFV
ncbi:predicted protein [Plenodomus lingam JN3]|uniref:Uncharacterized protein n=1 Tax=Leptosphaeria maculans (strain JN3 / isolate v23.1.3 / race Av1-4-5-6-7-8) TaxID=985895 RepID=E4ZGM0_LEPMJ|nr:predicted protein [Plenodomus lingam JN3]CBX90440.1 predicted protein [Plenodomus lingam JN3]